MGDAKLCVHKGTMVFYAQAPCPMCQLEKSQENLRDENAELREELVEAKRERITAVQDREKMFAEKEYWHDQAARLGQELHEIKCAQKEMMPLG